MELQTAPHSHHWVPLRADKPRVSLQYRIVDDNSVLYQMREEGIKDAAQVCAGDWIDAETNQALVPDVMLCADFDQETVVQAVNNFTDTLDISEITKICADVLLSHLQSAVDDLNDLNLACQTYQSVSLQDFVFMPARAFRDKFAEDEGSLCQNLSAENFCFLTRVRECLSFYFLTIMRPQNKLYYAKIQSQSTQLTPSQNSHFLLEFTSEDYPVRKCEIATDALHSEVLDEDLDHDISIAELSINSLHSAFDGLTLYYFSARDIMAQTFIDIATLTNCSAQIGSEANFLAYKLRCKQFEQPDFEMIAMLNSSACENLNTATMELPSWPSAANTFAIAENENKAPSEIDLSLQTLDFTDQCSDGTSDIDDYTQTINSNNPESSDHKTKRFSSSPPVRKTIKKKRHAQPMLGLKFTTGSECWTLLSSQYCDNQALQEWCNNDWFEPLDKNRICNAFALKSYVFLAHNHKLPLVKDYDSSLNKFLIQKLQDFDTDNDSMLLSEYLEELYDAWQEHDRCENPSPEYFRCSVLLCAYKTLWPYYRRSTYVEEQATLRSMFEDVKQTL
jgi:hypothetical protein